MKNIRVKIGQFKLKGEGGDMNTGKRIGQKDIVYLSPDALEGAMMDNGKLNHIKGEVNAWHEAYQYFKTYVQKAERIYR